ncbi:MAG TPA: BTAD domain-containing putative transcriptional regulator [Streptosporangiaceae bacterium]
MDFRLLGPVEVVLDGEPFGLAAPRQEIVLAMLLLEANRVVSVSRLVDALWDDEPPPTAKNQVHISVSALRRRLGTRAGPQPILTRSPGYVIRVPDEALDLRRFEAFAAKGAAAAAGQQPDAATRYFRAALDLWRGHAMAGVESRVVQTYATRWNETRLALLEDCLDLELQLGRHRAVICELTELVAEHPLRERLRAQMMLALYRSGRQAEALEVFRQGRAILLDELGLDPGEELRRLERAILSSDTSLDLSQGPVPGGMAAKMAGPPAPRQLPAAPADFTGRAALVERVVSLLSPGDGEDGGEGAGRGTRPVPVVVLTGKGGVGKTALALAAAHLLAERYPDGQLFAQVHGGSGQPESARRLLDRFLRSFGISPAALPADPAGQAAMYRSWLADRRLLVVIDDATCVEEVTPILPGSPTCAVIITSRNRLAGLAGAHQIEVGALDEESGMTLVTRMIDQTRAGAEMESLRQLVALCERLPLALRIAAARLAARPHWPISRLVRRLADERRRLDELDVDGISIRAMLSLSFNSLPELSRRLLLRLSMLGPIDFGSWVCAPLLDRVLDAAEETLETLVDARLVEAQVGEDGSVRYHLHDLIRIYAVERHVAAEPTAARDATLHRLLGCWLFLAAEAHRREYGGDFSIIHGGADPWPLPADTTDGLLRDPIGWLREEHNALVAAISQAGQAGLDELCWDLAMTAVTLFESGSYVDDWKKTHQRALTAVRAAGNRRGEAAMLYSLGTLALTGRLADAARYLEQSLWLFEDLDDVHGRALAQGGLAFVDRLGGRYESALTRFRTALADFRRAGDLIGEAHALKNMAQIHVDRQHFDIAEQFLGQAFEVCRKLGARRVTAQIEHELAELHLRRGDLANAQKSFESVRSTAQQAGDLIGRAYALLGMGMVRARLGQPQAARPDLRAALDLADDTGDLLLRGRALFALGELDFDMGDAGRAMESLDAALDVLSDLGSAFVWRARVLELVGRLHEQAGRAEAAKSAWRAAIALAGDADLVLAGQLAKALARVSTDPHVLPGLGRD